MLFSDSPGRGGRHDVDGIFAAVGPDIQQGLTLDGAQIIDIAPTAIHLMGLPIPEDMDGRVLSIFEEGSAPSIRPVEHEPAQEEELEEVSLTEKEQERLQAVLKGFGYLG